jgi:hypothetical protein
MLAPVAPAARADDGSRPITIRVDGRPVPFPDAQPLIANSRLLVPVRFVSEALGANVEWEGETRTVRIQQGSRFVRLHLAEGCGLDDCNGAGLAENTARLACLADNCTSGVLLDVAPRVVQGRTYVPLRFVAEALGAQVAWDPANRIADLGSGQGGGFSTATVQIRGLPGTGQIDGPTSVTVSSSGGTLLQLYAIDPATRQGYLIGASTDLASPLTVNNHAVPPGRYLVAAGVWTTDRWSYSLPQLITFTGNGTPWSGERKAWLSGYPDSLIYRYQLSVSALANFPRSDVTWLLDGVPQPDHSLTFTKTFTPADNGTHTLKARLTPSEGGAVVETDPIQFRVEASPLRLLGLGRDQVITTTLPVGVASNSSFTEVEYRVVNASGAVVRRETKPISQLFQLDPAALSEGAFTLAATGRRPDGSTAEAAALPFYAWPGGVPSSPSAATPEEQRAFLAQFQPIALAIYAQTGLSPSFQLAQAIHESGWGKAEATDLQTGARSYNLFGLKAREGEPAVRAITAEFVDGQPTYYLQRFKQFGNQPQAWQARAQMLLGSPLFAPVRMVRSNPDAVLAVLTEFGYATDPAYAGRLQALLDQPGLLPNGQSLRSLDRIQF